MSSWHRACLLSVVLAGVCACSSAQTNGPPSNGSSNGGSNNPTPDAASGVVIGPDDSGVASGVDSAMGSTTPPAEASAADSTPPSADDARAVSEGSDTSMVSSGDTPPARPLMVNTANPQLYTINFKPSDADPQAAAHDVAQTALVDTTKTMRAKLLVVLAGVGGAPGPIEVAQFAAALGFHAFAIAYENGYDPSTQNNPDYFGNSRNNELFGMGRTPGVTVTRPDSVEVRVTKALTYLQTKNSAGDWAYYFTADGKVRWSDVIFIGHSHGATSSAYFAKQLRVWRAISLSGPRDTNPVVATWLAMPSATPIDRFYGFTGTADPQHPDHIKSMNIMGYVGTLTDVTMTPAPYNNSHRLQYNGAHGDSANCANFAAVCRYMLGVP
jgi:hypothetical protein